MSFHVIVIDPVSKIQSKITDEEGVLRYDIDNSEVFPGPTGVRPEGSTITEVASIDAARDVAAAFVAQRMEAFGDDREALERYGFAAAELDALNMSEAGGKIKLPDNWIIIVVNTDEVE